MKQWTLHKLSFQSTAEISEIYTRLARKPKRNTELTKGWNWALGKNSSPSAEMSHFSRLTDYFSWRVKRRCDFKPSTFPQPVTALLLQRVSTHSMQRPGAGHIHTQLHDALVPPPWVQSPDRPPRACGRAGGAGPQSHTRSLSVHSVLATKAVLHRFWAPGIQTPPPPPPPASIPTPLPSQPSHSTLTPLSHAFSTALAPPSLTVADLYLLSPPAWWRWTPPCCRSPGSSPCSWGSPFPAPSPVRGNWTLTPRLRSPRRPLTWSSGSDFCHTNWRSNGRWDCFIFPSGL